jgi:hypothetical protein
VTFCVSSKANKSCWTFSRHPFSDNRLQYKACLFQLIWVKIPCGTTLSNGPSAELKTPRT